MLAKQLIFSYDMILNLIYQQQIQLFKNMVSFSKKALVLILVLLPLILADNVDACLEVDDYDCGYSPCYGYYWSLTQDTCLTCPESNYDTCSQCWYTYDPKTQSCVDQNGQSDDNGNNEEQEDGVSCADIAFPDECNKCGDYFYNSNTQVCTPCSQANTAKSCFICLEKEFSFSYLINCVMYMSENDEDQSNSTAESNSTDDNSTTDSQDDDWWDDDSTQDLSSNETNNTDSSNSTDQNWSDLNTTNNTDSGFPDSNVTNNIDPSALNDTNSSLPNNTDLSALNDTNSSLPNKTDSNQSDLNSTSNTNSNQTSSNQTSNNDTNIPEANSSTNQTQNNTTNENNKSQNSSSQANEISKNVTCTSPSTVYDETSNTCINCNQASSTLCLLCQGYTYNSVNSQCMECRYQINQCNGCPLNAYSLCLIGCPNNFYLNGSECFPIQVVNASLVLDPSNLFSDWNTLDINQQQALIVSNRADIEQSLLKLIGMEGQPYRMTIISLSIGSLDVDLSVAPSDTSSSDSTMTEIQNSITNNEWNSGLSVISSSFVVSSTVTNTDSSPSGQSSSSLTSGLNTKIIMIIVIGVSVLVIVAIIVYLFVSWWGSRGVQKSHKLAEQTDKQVRAGDLVKDSEQKLDEFQSGSSQPNRL